MRTTQDNKELVSNSDIVVIAVKPNIVKEILQEVAPVVQTERHLFISIAAGVTIRAIEQVNFFICLSFAGVFYQHSVLLAESEQELQDLILACLIP